MEVYLIEREEKRKLFNETLELANKIYEINNVGGLLHIVLDDGNLKNNHIESCIEYIKLSDDNNKDHYLKCANNILKMSQTQRLKLYSSIRR